jgi:hypothetical protein
LLVSPSLERESEPRDRETENNNEKSVGKRKLEEDNETVTGSPMNKKLKSVTEVYTFIFKDALRFVVSSLILCINSNTKLVNSRQIEGHP